MARVWQLIPLALVVTVLFGPVHSAKPPNDKLSPGLVKVMEVYGVHPEMGEIPVIVQMNPGKYHPHGIPPGLVRAKNLDLIHSFAGLTDVKGIQGLIHSPWVEYVTVDAAVTATGNFVTTVGLKQSYSSSLKRVSNDVGYDGTGLTVAILDSGLTGHGVGLRAGLDSNDGVFWTGVLINTDNSETDIATLVGD